MKIIQGGMGASISNWRLAQAVSKTGELGVVSGTGLDVIMSRMLQKGDKGGFIKSALERFPNPEIAEKIYEKYFIEGGKDDNQPFINPSKYEIENDNELLELTVVANFVEVTLAKDGHTNPIGINFLEKIQMPLLPAIYGAMLAGVDNVFMGAGLPLQIAKILDEFRTHNPMKYNLTVIGNNKNANIGLEFDPSLIGCTDTDLIRPDFYPIITLPFAGKILTKKQAPGSMQGFIVEGYSAGGHNASPRGNPPLNAKGEPTYGPRDIPDLNEIKKFKLPFWLAGGYGTKDGLERAIQSGAEGIQVGTLFEFCDESGLDPKLKNYILSRILEHDIQILTDAKASPTGFPFKVAKVVETLSTSSNYRDRKRICELGFLRTPYLGSDGKVGYRCPSEPIKSYVAKGGDPKDTIGRKCLCDALAANAGVPQVRKDGYIEEPLITAGDSINIIKELITKKKPHYSAQEVIGFLLNKD